MKEFIDLLLPNAMWGKVTLYNCCQMFVQLVGKKMSNPAQVFSNKLKSGQYDRLDNKEINNLAREANRKSVLWNSSPELDCLSLYFNATDHLPKNTMRTLVGNINNSLKSMAGADKMMASVYAMRQGGAAGSGSVSAKGAVEDKSFSTTDGKSIQFTDTGIYAASVSSASSFTVSKDGTLNMEAKNIVLCAQNELNIGKGMIHIGDELQEVIPQNTILQAKTGIVGLGILNFENEEINIAEDKIIVFDAGNNILIAASGKLYYEPDKIDPPGIQYSDAELRKEDAAQRKAHNAEVFEVRERESKGKAWVGRVVGGIGAVLVIGAVTVLSGGTALVVGGAGIAAFVCGASQEAEGMQDLAKMGSGDFSQSYNAVRDGVFGRCENKQEIYETVMYGSVMIGLGALLSPLGKLLVDVPRWLLAGQMATAGGLSAGTMFLRDISDGYVDSGWQEYLASFGVSAATAGIGFGIGMGAKCFAQNSELVTGLLSKSGVFSPALVIGAETGIDVFVDWSTSKLFNQNFDWKMSLLTSLASNIAFSIDPVNMATGGLLPDCNGPGPARPDGRTLPAAADIQFSNPLCGRSRKELDAGAGEQALYPGGGRAHRCGLHGRPCGAFRAGGRGMEKPQKRGFQIPAAENGRGGRFCPALHTGT